MAGIFKHHADVLDAIIESSFDGLWICDGEGKSVNGRKILPSYAPNLTL